MVGRKVIIPVIKKEPVCTAEPVAWMQTKDPACL